MAVNWDSNSINTLFSSLPSRSFGFFGTGNDTSANMLSDYYSIKNGSYGKLMKAYYNSESEEVSKIASKATSNVTKNKSDVSSDAKVASEVKSSANALKDSANTLIDNKLARCYRYIKLIRNVISASVPHHRSSGNRHLICAGMNCRYICS